MFGDSARHVLARGLKDHVEGRIAVDLDDLGAVRSVDDVDAGVVEAQRPCRPRCQSLDRRREGDLLAFWADATKAKELLGWEATHTVEDMCKSSWEFARKSAEVTEQ